MADETDPQGKVKDAPRAFSTRRSMLIKMMGVGVSGVLVDGAKAHVRHGHHRHGFHAGTPRVTPTQQANFIIAVNAFNSMATVPEAQSKLWQVLDPGVVAFDVTFDVAKATGIQQVIDYFYGLVVKNINGQLVGPVFNPWAPSGPPPNGPYGPPDYSQPKMVRGSAQWIDTDGTGAEKIKYHFGFNGNLLASLHAR